MPDGAVKKTRSAFSRWSSETLGWGEMTAEQQREKAKDMEEVH